MEIDSNPTGVGQLAPLGSGCVCTTDTVADASGNSLTSILAAKDTAIDKKADASAIPTKTSQLTNDSGFLTSHQSLADYAKTADVNTALAAKADATELAKKQDTLVSGTSIKTINGLDLLGEGNITIEGGGSGGSGTVTGVSVNGAAAISPDSSGIVKLTDVGSAATIASQAKTIASQATTIANLQSQIDKYKPHWWAWVTCSHEVNIKINGTTITLPEGRSKIEDFESVMYDSSDMTKFVDGITGFDIYSTGSWPLTRMQLGGPINGKGQGMSNIQSIDVSKADLRNTTSLQNAFYNCTNLTSLGDLSSWSPSKVTNMNSMFKNCSSLTSLDLFNWDTSKVTDIGEIFVNCSSLTSIGDLSNWDTSKVKNMNNMFYSCSSLTSVGDLSGWDTSEVTSMNGTFSGCSSLTSLGDLSNWDTSKVKDMSRSFGSCNLITDFSFLCNWNLSSCTSISGMFQQAQGITTLDLSKWNTSKVTNIAYAIYNNTKCTSVDVSGWDLSSCTNMTCIFDYMSKLNNLILGEGWGKSPSSGLTLGLNHIASTLTDESWASFKTLYDRASDGLPTMTIKFSTAHKTNYADWDSFVEYMTARGYNITTA